MNNAVETENILLSAVYHKIDSEFTAKKAHSLKLFAMQYFASTSKAELKKNSTTEIYRQLLEAWNFVYERKSSAPKIEFVQHNEPGTESNQFSTNIFILLDDMPFIVDSIRQGLNRAGVTIKRVNNAVIYAQRKPAGNTKTKSTTKTGLLTNLVSGEQEGYRAEAVAREMIHQFKYGRDLSLRCVLGGMLRR